MSAHSRQYQRRGSDILDGPAQIGEREDDEQSIIDVFEFDDTVQDRWLCSIGTSSRRNSAETKIEDLDAWLHADLSEMHVTPPDTESRRSIDTRTFTRIKRRNNRLNFDTVEASVSPETMPFSLSNVWKNQVHSESPIQNINNNNDKEQILQKERRDSIPMMLRPKTNQMLAALLSESPSSISSQTSMEAFMNLARSKEGINSLLSDMSDPDVSHFLMNISQPSLLYSSIISDSRGDESLIKAEATMTDSLVDSQILTDSMMEASMFKEVQDTTMLAQFLKQNDCTVLEDETFCKSPNSSDTNDKTFVNENLSDKTYINVKDKPVKISNETFVTNENSKANNTFTSLLSPLSKNEANSTKIISPQENVLDTTRVINNTPSILNSTKTIYDHQVPVLLKNKEDFLSLTQTLNSENKTDATFEIQSSPASPNGDQLDATFQTSNFPAAQVPELHTATENCGNSLDTTFNAVPTLRAELLQEVRRSSGNKFDATFTNPQLPNIEAKFDITYDHINAVESLDDTEVLDATYVQMPSMQHHESETVQKSLDVTYDTTQVNPKLSIPGNIPGTRRMSYAKHNRVESQMQSLDPNRFNTFRKDSKIGSRLSKVQQMQENNSNKVTAPLQPHVPSAKNNDALYQQRFNTFSKKTSSIKNNIYTENKVDDSKKDKKISKPADKLPRQIQAPRQLSKLPQLFQKSNPNLGSSIKPLGKPSTIAKFSKGSQPNVSGNTCLLGRFKSEQRLLPAKHNTEFPVVEGTSRSMESIDSTASAHSAPDLDDRLSICSDISRASYTIKPRNLETLKKLASMEEPGMTIGGSTPKVKGRQILENAWVEEKDLPSPILKNGKNYAGSADSRSTSPSDSADYNAKTSSPLTISPDSSDHAINIIGNDDGIESAKENIGAVENIRPKQIKAPNSLSTATKLRRPSNWTGTSNKIANGAVSGIPRPASRIPAPKFARPNLK